jgi:hypothetical protein
MTLPQQSNASDPHAKGCGHTYGDQHFLFLRVVVLSGLSRIGTGV